MHSKSPINQSFSIGIQALVRLVTVDRANLEASKAAFNSERGVVILFEGGHVVSVHEITADHQSLSSTISCVTDRIRFLLVTMSDRFSNFNSISYKEDRHELRVTSAKC